VISRYPGDPVVFLEEDTWTSDHISERTRKRRAARAARYDPSDDAESLMEDMDGTSGDSGTDAAGSKEDRSPEPSAPPAGDFDSVAGAKPSQIDDARARAQQEEIDVGGSKQVGSPSSAQEKFQYADEAADQFDNKAAVEQGSYGKDESCEFNLHGECVSPAQCEEMLCNGHGYCFKYSTGPACECDPGYASSGGQFCNTCEHDSNHYPSCATESMGDKLAEAIAMERICQVFELPSTIDLPGMLGTRNTFFLTDWFLGVSKSTTSFKVGQPSYMRVYLIPGDPRDLYSARVVSKKIGEEKLVASSTVVGDAHSPLAHEMVLEQVLSEGEYRLEVLMGGDPGDTKGKDCKRFHINIEISPTTRQLKPLKPNRCPPKTTIPKAAIEKLERKSGIYLVTPTGFEYSSVGSTLATVWRESDKKEGNYPKLVYHFDFTTERIVGMIPYIDASLSSAFLSGHMRLVVIRLDEYVNLQEWKKLNRRSPEAGTVDYHKLHASAQVFVANNNADVNHVAMDLSPGVSYRLAVYEMSHRLPSAECSFYDLSFWIDYADIRAENIETSLGDDPNQKASEAREWVVDRCAMVALPQTFNIPGYLGYTGKTMHIHETFRYNPNVHEHHTTFQVLDPSLLRIYIPFHQTQLTVTTHVIREAASGVANAVDDSGRTIASGSNEVNDDVTTELHPGTYRIVFMFKFSDTLVRTPGAMRCVGFEAEIALMPLKHLGGDAHWCGPSGLEVERLPVMRNLIARGMDRPLVRSHTLLNQLGNFEEKRIQFSVTEDGMTMRASIGSDFVTGHIGVLIQNRKKANSSTRLVLPAHQTQPNHAYLSRQLSKGDYDLVIRPLFVYSKRSCVPFDLQVSLTKDNTELDRCYRGGYEAFPSTFNSVRFLGGSGQSHRTHFSGKFFVVPDSSESGMASFSLSRTSEMRVAISHSSHLGATVRLEYFPCVQKQQPPYPYVGLDYEIDYFCDPQVVWEDFTMEFSKVQILNPGYYRLTLAKTKRIKLPCLKFHMELAIAPLPPQSEQGDEDDVGGMCPHQADHLPPHPPEVLAKHYHYDSQEREEHLAYQLRPDRKISFMAPFVAEKPFRMMVEIGYDFLPGDLRIDLTRHPANPQTHEESNVVERIFKGRPLNGRRRRLAASVLPPGRYSLWMHSPPMQEGDRGSIKWACLAFTWRLEIHVLQPQRGHRSAPAMLHPELQERLPAYPPLPLTLNRAGCLVPTGECELFGVFAVMHQVWNANLPAQNWEENSVSFTLHRESLVRIHASPHVLGSIQTKAMLHIRLVALGENEVDLQAPKNYVKDDTTSDDWLVKQLQPGKYAFVVNIQYPGTAKAWHAWRMHFPVSLHVAIAYTQGSSLWADSLPWTRSDAGQQCAGKLCGSVTQVPSAEFEGVGNSYKLDLKSEMPCVHEPQHAEERPDPSCRFGIKSGDGTACCPSGCTKCGGENCNLLPLGEKNCCALRIKEHSESCSVSSAPCNMFGDGSLDVHTFMISVTQPEGVSLIAETSFNFLHHHLTLLLEGESIGYSPNGRSIRRDVTFKGVSQHMTAYLDVDLMPGVYNVTLTELGPAPAAHLGPCSSRKYSLLLYIKSKQRTKASSSSSSSSRNSFAVQQEKVENWQKLLDQAASDGCALSVDIPESLLPLPENLWAYRSRFRNGHEDESSANQAALVQSWGGPMWSRVHADGFNIVQTNAKAVALETLNIRGEGGAFLVRVSAKVPTTVRITATTNKRDEQLLYALVNATGHFVTPTAHYPTDFENSALFVIGYEDKHVTQGVVSDFSNALNDDVASDPMDADLARRFEYTGATSKSDFYMVLQPRRTPRNDANFHEESQSCPLFSVDMAAAPVHELYEYLSIPHKNQDSCREVAPAQEVMLDAQGQGSQAVRCFYTSKSESMKVRFRLTHPSLVNATLLHNFLSSDFVVELIREEEEAEEGNVIALSEDNVFVFGESDRPEEEMPNLTHDSHPMIASNDVGCVISKSLNPGSYYLQITEHTLTHYPNLVGAGLKLLCVEFLWKLDIIRIDGVSTSAYAEESVSASASGSGAAASATTSSERQEPTGSPPQPSPPSSQSSVDEADDDMQSLLNDVDPVPETTRYDRSNDGPTRRRRRIGRSSEPESEEPRGYNENQIKRPEDNAYHRRRDRRRARGQWDSSPSSHPEPEPEPEPDPEVESEARSTYSDRPDASNSGRTRTRRKMRREERGVREEWVPPPPETEVAGRVVSCREDSCGCKRGSTAGICQSIGSCSVHTYSNVYGDHQKILCNCPENYEGSTCQRCKRGFDHYPDCTPVNRGGASDGPSFIGKNRRGSGGSDSDETLPETPPEIEGTRPRMPVLVAYALTVTACLCVLTAILVHLKKKSKISQVRDKEGIAVYTFRDDGL